MRATSAFCDPLNEGACHSLDGSPPQHESLSGLGEVLGVEVKKLVFDPSSRECRAWVEAHEKCNDHGASRKVAEALLQNVSYHSQQDLEDSLLAQIKELEPKLKNYEKTGNRNFEKILIPFHHEKSTEWIVNNPRIKDALSKYNVFPYMINPEPHVDDFVEQYKKNEQVKNQFIDFDSGDPELIKKQIGALKGGRTTFLFLDDAVYSGEQISRYAEDRAKEMAYQIKKLERTGTIYSISAFSTDAGDSRIRNSLEKPEYNGVQIETTSYKRIPNLQDLFGSQPQLFDQIKKAYAVGDRHTLSFFAHKVPDYASAPEAFFRHGTVQCIGSSQSQPDEDVYYASFNCIPHIKPPYKKKRDWESFSDCCDGSRPSEASCVESTFSRMKSVSPHFSKAPQMNWSTFCSKRDQARAKVFSGMPQTGESTQTSCGAASDRDRSKPLVERGTSTKSTPSRKSQDAH